MQAEPDIPEPMHAGEVGECFCPLSNTAVSSDPENFLWEREAVPSNPVRSWLKQESSRGEGGSPHRLPTAPISGDCFRGAG